MAHGERWHQSQHTGHERQAGEHSHGRTSPRSVARTGTARSALASPQQQRPVHDRVGARAEAWARGDFAIEIAVARERERTFGCDGSARERRNPRSLGRSGADIAGPISCATARSWCRGARPATRPSTSWTRWDRAPRSARRVGQTVGRELSAGAERTFARLDRASASAANVSAYGSASNRWCDHPPSD